VEEVLPAEPRGQARLDLIRRILPRVLLDEGLDRRDRAEPDGDEDDDPEHDDRSAGDEGGLDEGLEVEAALLLVLGGRVHARLPCPGAGAAGPAHAVAGSAPEWDGDVRD